MSENAETFQRSVDAWNRGDFETWTEQFDPDFEWFALLEVYRGHAGARQAWENFKANMQLAVRFDDVRDLGETVLALGEMHAKGPTTGLDLRGELAQLATFRAGKVLRVRDFANHAEALRAAGLSQ